MVLASSAASAPPVLSPTIYRLVLVLRKGQKIIIYQSLVVIGTKCSATAQVMMTIIMTPLGCRSERPMTNALEDLLTR